MSRQESTTTGDLSTPEMARVSPPHAVGHQGELVEAVADLQLGHDLGTSYFAMR